MIAPQGRTGPAPAPARMGRRAALGAIAGALAGIPATGQGQPGADWPSQPVRYINIFPPGGATDTGEGRGQRQRNDEVARAQSPPWFRSPRGY
jgi:hypothetical protein